MFKADLHCHSSLSDGTDTPKQLVDLALELGLSGLSITDHDTIAAYPSVLEYAAKKNLQMITGVEFSASYRFDPVHVLGYGYDPENHEIQLLCHHHQNRRHERNEKILENLAKMGIHISYDELGSEGSIGRPHIAQILQKRGVVSSIKEAFDRYLGEGKAAYDPGEPITVEETIHTIHAAKGKAVLAHPHLLKRSSTIRYALSLPFDGLEGYYAKIPLDQEQKWIDIAKQKGWIVTGGSDYHGSVKPLNILGSSWVTEDAFNALK